jgi:hypothetical protein
MMPRKTILAVARAHVSPSQALSRYLNRFGDGRPDAWFARAGGDVFLAEMGEQLNVEFADHLTAFFSSYMREIGIFDEKIMTVDITDAHRGSWIMEAAISMFCGVGTAYQILKGAGELPKIADGIEESKIRLQEELRGLFRKSVRLRIEPYFTESKTANPGTEIPRIDRLEQAALQDPVDVSFFIDARPLRGLTPDIVKTHAIHLSVGLSRSGFSVENLGDDPLQNVRVGLFKSVVEVQSWYFGDAYMKMIPTISGKQSMSISMNEFRKHGSNVTLDLDDNVALYVDCWIQDNHGIYLFNFLLD